MELKNFFVQDDQGNKLPGAVCYLYMRGTETPAVGAVKANGVPIENPFIADDSGLLQLAAPNGLYDLRVTSPGRDNRLRLQFNDVGESLESAQVAAQRAEVARDAAQLSAGVYGDTAAGLAATTSGKYFSVPSVDSKEFLILYKNVNGVAVESKRYPSQSFVSAASELISNIAPSAQFPSLDLDWPYVIEDMNGYPLLGVRGDGVAHAVLDAMPGLPTVSDYAWSITDANDVVLIGITWDGQIVIYGQDSVAVTAYADGPVGAQDIFVLINGVPYQITSKGDNFSPVAASGRVRYIQRKGLVTSVSQNLPAEGSIASFVTKFLHILASGQSLSVGGGSVATTTQPPVANRMLTLQSGVRLSNQNDTLTNEMVVPFKPLVSNQMEAPVTQLTAQLGRLRALPDNAGTISSVHGRTGYPIASLSKGSIYYANSITAVASAKAECSRLGYGYEVPFLDWIQGENDRHAAAGYYTAQLLQLQSDYNTDIKAASGQTKNIKILLDQISNWTAYNIASSNVPLEQLQVALDYPERFVCAGPKYWLQTNAEDGQHLSGENYTRLAAMHARPAEALINGYSWLPTHARSAVRTGDKVSMKFHCPVYPLVIDTELVTDPGNLGLRWIDDANSASITGVRLSSFDTLEITLSAIPSGANPKIGIADIGAAGAFGGPTTGPRACLRDSQPDVDPYGGHVFNWACHQQIQVV